MTAALSTWWIIGWAAGGFVVLLAASLLLTIITLGRRIVRQAGDIAVALDGARTNTGPLFDLANTNFALERIARGLARAREEAAEEENPGVEDGGPTWSDRLGEGMRRIREGRQA